VSRQKIDGVAKEGLCFYVSVAVDTIEARHSVVLSTAFYLVEQQHGSREAVQYKTGCRRSRATGLASHHHQIVRESLCFPDALEKRDYL